MLASASFPETAEFRLPKNSAIETTSKQQHPFVSYFLADPAYGPACRDLLQRIENQELRGFTSAHVVGEVAHRVMTLEAIDRFGWPAKGIAARLRKRHSEIPHCP